MKPLIKIINPAQMLLLRSQITRKVISPPKVHLKNISKATGGNISLTLKKCSATNNYMAHSLTWIEDKDEHQWLLLEHLWCCLHVNAKTCLFFFLKSSLLKEFFQKLSFESSKKLFMCGRKPKCIEKARFAKIPVHLGMWPRSRLLLAIRVNVLSLQKEPMSMFYIQSSTSFFRPHAACCLLCFIIITAHVNII